MFLGGRPSFLCVEGRYQIRFQSREGKMKLKQADIRQLMEERPAEAVRLIQAAADVLDIEPTRMEKVLDFQDAIGRGGMSRWTNLHNAVWQFVKERV
jgi:hypothetical protein